MAQVRAILDMDDVLRAELGGLDVPTLVLVGSQDILTPMGDSEELAEEIPGAELAVIRGAAHGFMLEHRRGVQPHRAGLPRPRHRGPRHRLTGRPRTESYSPRTAKVRSPMALCATNERTFGGNESRVLRRYCERQRLANQVFGWKLAKGTCPASARPWTFFSATMLHGVQ